MIKMSIGENYVGKLTPMRSNISRFSRGSRERDRTADNGSAPLACHLAYRCRHIANNENDLSEYWNSISQFFHSRLSCIVELVKDNGLTFIQFWLIECRNFHALDLSRRGGSSLSVWLAEDFPEICPPIPAAEICRFYAGGFQLDRAHSLF